MKKLLITLLSILIVTIPEVTVFAIEYFVDFLEPSNPGGWTTGLKTQDENYTVNVGDEIEADIYMSAPIGLFSTGFLIEYDPLQVSIVSVEVYDGSNLPGPWDPDLTSIVPEPDGLGTYFALVGNFACVDPDIEGDIIVAKVRFFSESCDDALITFRWPLDEIVGPPCGNRPVGCDESCYEEIPPPIVVTLHQGYENDRDCDGISDSEDNCPLHPNSPLLGICFQGMWGKTCLSDEECSTGTLGRCSMDQTDNIRCDCKSNFDCDYDVDGTDAARFKADFGRSLFNNPCINQDPCNGDFECDGDVDGTDAADFKKYFGVTPFSGYCLACVDGVFQYDCSY